MKRYYGQLSDKHGSEMFVDTGTCALCQFQLKKVLRENEGLTIEDARYKMCETCPLPKAIGGPSCEGDQSPYGQFTRTGRTGAMLSGLEDALRSVNAR